MSGYGCIKMEDEYIRRHHRHEIRDNQCSSSLVKHIKAPVHLVSIFPFCLYFLFSFFFQVACLSIFLTIQIRMLCGVWRWFVDVAPACVLQSCVDCLGFCNCGEISICISFSGGLFLCLFLFGGWEIRGKTTDYKLLISASIWSSL